MSSPSVPFHESVGDKLHPEYVNFYHKFLVNLPQVQYQPISVSRAGSPVVAGGSNPVPVGQKQDYLICRRETPGPEVPVRVFTPVGSPADTDGWPVVLYMHRGGFVLGNIDTENTVCSHICTRARCIVITVDYRLAPESPFPLPSDDCLEAFLWMITEGTSLLKLDLNKIAIGGAPAGAILAAVVAQRATEGPQPKAYQVLSQVLVVPVLDNTADTENNPT